MIEFRQKQFAIGGVLGAGLSNLGAGVGTAATGVAKGAVMAGKGLLAGAVPATIGTGQVAASGLAAGAGVLGKAALWGASHPLLLGGLAAYGIYRLLKRRRQRRMQERGYSVVEKIFSDPEYSEKIFVRPNKLTKVITRYLGDPEKNKEAIERLQKVKGKKYPILKVLYASEVEDQLSIPMPTPKAPRELVPKKIVKKAKKSGVVQKDSDGNWRIINMHGPQGPIYWAPKYSSKEKAENCLRAYQAGKWNKKK